MNLLLDKVTAEKGRKLLDSLVKENNWQATFLKSRLYFDTRGEDTMFYEEQWRKMRDNCGIIPDNKMAHKYLYDAFVLKEDDFMILYQLGRDFKTGTERGCDRNPNFALWCFDSADTLNNSTLNNAYYREELDLRRKSISRSSNPPIKPSR